MELHLLCTLFPRMSDADFKSLCDDITLNGLIHPIITHEGMILDGGNRYRACLAVNVEPVFEEFSGGNLVDYVIAVNLHRRHMTPGQQAAIVASAQNWATAQPASRPKAGNLTGLSTVADRTAQSGASDKTQRMADKVAKESPELAKQVAHGEKTLPQAVEELTGTRPGAKKADPEPAYNPKDDEAAELANTIKHLAEENEALKDRIAIDAMDFSEEEKTAASDTIKKLRQQVKNFEVELKAVKVSRDNYQRENAEMKKQISMQRKEIERLKK